MDLGLQDKVALVTGSSRGLGLASAKALAAEGARVMLTARGAEQLARAADEVVALSSTDAVGRSWPIWPPPPASSTPLRRPSTRSVGSTSSSTTWAWRGRGTAGHQRRRVAGGVRSDAVSADPRVAARRPAHAAKRRRRHHLHHLDLGTRVGRPHDLQRREGGRNQPRQVARAAAGARQHPRRAASRRDRSCFPAARGTSGSRPIPRASPSSFSASCRLAASAAPTKSATSSRSSRRRARAGSAAPPIVVDGCQSKSNI